ncbi:hypothetical protein [Mycoplasmopsis gallinacea]|uniref:Uncharacterized protein n=1 Tax=Mycoplasmopsis gallinacea TaxID=29556 RepID=A0A449A2S7_9BACT|nr:hypothetical protein [Mycoplasmopsis gallinacea]VEU58556.1 Uncharacterised protein [Mycoplasmopsis gallinacea]VEU59044.1 Uncharacterised protein [Mycoplasmopsis gallinacea]
MITQVIRYFETDYDWTNAKAKELWITSIRGYSIAKLVLMYVLPVIIAIAIVLSIYWGLKYKFSTEQHQSKKGLFVKIGGAVLVVVASGILLGVLTQTLFPGEVNKLLAEGVKQDFITLSGNAVSNKNSALSAEQVSTLASALGRFGYYVS